MAIIETTDKKTGKKIYKYQQPEWKILYEKLAILLDSFGSYVNAHNDLTLDDIKVDEPMLAELLVRIDKRKDYFIIFHDDTEMNEIKEAALVAYWLLKFKPFSIKESRSELHIKYGQINEAFAVFVLYSAIKEETKRVPKMKFSISKEYNKKIMYGFKFWDISKEALMLISESLCEAMYMRKEEGNV